MLSKKQILKQIEDGNIKISPLSKKVSEDAIEIHISNEFLSYPPNVILEINTPSQNFNKHIIPEDGFVMKPGDFYLAKIAERITLAKNIMAWIENAGSLANIGIQIHLCDAHIDAGTNSNIILQVTNQGKNPVKLYPNSYIGKLYFSEVL